MQRAVTSLSSRVRAKLTTRALAIIAAVGAIIAVGGGAAAGEFYVLLSRPSARAAQIEQTLKIVAKRVRETLPEKLNAVTTMTDLTYENKNMTYAYQVDTRGEAPREVMATLRDYVTARACVGEFKEAMQYGYVFTFRYNNLFGARLGEFTLSAANCR